MTVTSIDKDVDNLTLTLVADFAAPPSGCGSCGPTRVSSSAGGAAQLPGHLRAARPEPGRRVTYFMTSPEGEKFHGWWRVTSVDAPKSLEFTDGFADEDGVPAADMPVTTVRMELVEHDGGTRMELRSVFDTREQMEQLDTMGMTEGLRVGRADGRPARRLTLSRRRRPLDVTARAPRRPRARRRRTASAGSGTSSRTGSSSRATVALRNPSISGRATRDRTGVTSTSQYDESRGVRTGTSTINGRSPRIGDAPSSPGTS